MPLPQVNDRIKEIPAQTLRAVFAGIGQILLIADKLRTRAAEQISGPDAPPAAGPAGAAQPAAAPSTPDAGQPAPAAGAAQPAVGAAQPADATSTPGAGQPDRTPPAKRGARPAAAQRPRWRSLDETGNVRLLDDAEEELAPGADAPAGSPATVLAESAATTPAAPPAESGPATAPAESPATAPAAATAGDTAPDVPAAAGALPLANYDHLSLASLRARLRVLDAAQVGLLLDYEKAHESRPDVVIMFERRIAKLNTGS
jgi:hypothetical protein